MEQSLNLKFFRKLLSKQGEDGFSLIELVVVVSVLAVLSAIAIPTFSCFQRKAQATAALAAMKQIQTECEINKADTGNAGTFTSSNLNSYQIQSDGSNGCSGASTTGLISAIPNNTNNLPTFLLASNSNELTYSFKGQTGTDLSKGLGLVCSVVKGGSAFQTNIEANSFVRKDTYIERGCSAYVLVDGPNWSDANANAIALGGNLVSVTDEDENNWLGEEFSKVKYQYSDDNHSWAPDEWSINHFWTGGTRNSNGVWEWTNGGSFDNSLSNLVLNNNLEEGPDSNSVRLLAILNNPNHQANPNLYLDDMTETPIEGSYQGMVEIPICNN